MKTVPFRAGLAAFLGGATGTIKNLRENIGYRRRRGQYMQVFGFQGSF